MKMLKNKKGFTLIELLAVIVVLAIVTVLATRSILPYMQSAGRDAFAIEANEAKNGASDAMSLISLGKVDSSDYTYDEVNKTYCFTVENLNAIGVWMKDDDNYKGTVVVTPSGIAYEYAVEMYNEDYYVETESGEIKSEDRSDTNKNGVGRVTDSIKSSLKTTCE